MSRKTARARNRRAIDYLSRNYAQDFTKLVPRYALAGDPDACRVRVQEFIDAGASLVILAPASDSGAESDRNVEFMADNIVTPMRG